MHIEMKQGYVVGAIPQKVWVIIFRKAQNLHAHTRTRARVPRARTHTHRSQMYMHTDMHNHASTHAPTLFIHYGRGLQ